MRVQLSETTEKELSRVCPGLFELTKNKEYEWQVKSVILPTAYSKAHLGFGYIWDFHRTVTLGIWVPVPIPSVSLP